MIAATLPRVGVPPEGLGQQITDMTAWLDDNSGADGWAMTPSGMRGVLNDALSIYFLDATLASALVARWCAGHRVATAQGVFRIRAGEPTARILAAMHRTPGSLVPMGRQLSTHSGRSLPSVAMPAPAPEADLYVHLRQRWGSQSAASDRSRSWVFSKSNRSAW
jgi:hypothetical protein